MNLDQFFDALAVVPNLRTATFDDLEMTRKKEGFRFTGHAAVYDEEAVIDEIPGVGVVSESVARGAFPPILRTIEQNGVNIPFTLEHDEAKVLATTRSKRLRLSDDNRGLAVEADLPPTSLSRDLYALVDAGVVTGMSYGFVTGPRSSGNWTIERRSSGAHRRITGFKKLLDVTATWNPTFPSAEAQFRSAALRFADSAESLQQILRGAYQARGDGAASGDTESDRKEFRQAMSGSDEEQIEILGNMIGLSADFITNEDEQPDIDRMTRIQAELEAMLKDELGEDANSEAGVSGAAERRARVRSVAARKRALTLLLQETGGIT